MLSARSRVVPSTAWKRGAPSKTTRTAGSVSNTIFGGSVPRRGGVSSRRGASRAAARTSSSGSVRRCRVTAWLSRVARRCCRAGGAPGSWTRDTLTEARVTIRRSRLIWTSASYQRVATAASASSARRIRAVPRALSFDPARLSASGASRVTLVPPSCSFSGHSVSRGADGFFCACGLAGGAGAAVCAAAAPASATHATTARPRDEPRRSRAFMGFPPVRIAWTAARASGLTRRDGRHGAALAIRSRERIRTTV